MMAAVAVSSLRRTDVVLWLAVVLLVPLGIVLVHSASLEGARDERVSGAALRQGAYAVLGVAGMLLAARVDYRRLRRWSTLAYLATLLLLAAVLVVGVREHGAQRWLGAGGVTLQPSELAKLALALALAAYCGDRAPRGPMVVIALGVLAAPLALVALQPDVGTLIVLSGIWMAVAIAWGLSWRVLGGLSTAALGLGPLLFALAVPAYQRERLAVFFDPERDPLGSGFNLRQVEIAMGTGGVTGHGLFSGAEQHLDSVAARSSDFMFGFASAELGLLGGLALLALLAVVVVRGFAAALRAPDAFGRVLAAGLTGAILTQCVVNVAVNLRLFPTTGIPLPFVSQGGSSLVAVLVAVGLLQSIASQRPPREMERWLDDGT